MFATAGGMRVHSLITANLIGELRSAFRGGRCIVYSNLRLKIEATGLYTYPDVIVASVPFRPPFLSRNFRPR